MAQQHDDTEQKVTRHPRSRWRTLRRFGIGITIVFAIIFALQLLTGWLYHGPKTLTDVVAVMPDVPLFPLAQVAPANPHVQRALAIPLWLLRHQGAERAEAVELSAPAEADFVADWYRQIAPTQDWVFIGQEMTENSIRLVFSRKREGLQVTIGRTHDSILAPLQLMYMKGLTEKQVRELKKSV